MKKYIIVSILMFIAILSGWSQSTVTLEFRLNSPRIIYDLNNSVGGSGSNCQNLDFDIEVKGDAISYCHALEVHMTTNMSALADLDFTLASSGWTSWYSLITYNLTGNNINLSVANSKGQGSGNTTWWTQIPTTWKVLGTLRLRITDPTAMQNCTWVTAQMTGMQKEKYFGGTPGVRTYLGFTCTGIPVSNLYLGRIYSSTWSWSQTGGSSAGSQFTDWTAAVNTSVWDTLSSSATIANAGSKAAALRVHSGARLTINATKDFTCSGATEINEPRGLVIAADATGLGQFIDNGSITYNTGGSVRTQCYFSQMKWHYLCIPITNTNVAPFHNLYVKYYLEATHNWKYIYNPAMDSVLNTSMTGYSLWSHSTNPPMGNYTVNLTGSLNTGSLSIPVTRTLNGADYDGYNLVGNPYCSALDLSSGSITWNNVEQKAWFWDPTAGNYTIYNVAGGGDHTSYCPPQQGFFVHHTTANSTITSFACTNSARVINAEPYLKDNSTLSDYLVLHALSAAGSKSDETMLYFRPEATTAYDESFDAEKKWGDFDAPQLYSIIPTNLLMLNALPHTGPSQVISLGFSCGVSGDFSISAENIQSFDPLTQIFLEDLKENKTQNLNQNNTYSFTYLAGDDPARFILHFSNPTYGVEPKSSEPPQVYSCRDAVYVKKQNDSHVEGSLVLINSLGQNVFSSRLENVTLNKFIPDIPSGYYVAFVILNNLVITRKIALTN